MDTILNHPVTLSFIIALPLFGIVAKIFGATFQRIARWYLYIAVFAVLIVMNSIFFPFIGGKDYFFRFTVELALIFYILYWAFEARQGEVEGALKAWYKKPLFIAVSAFVVVVLLSCIFALDPHAAFWSNYERGEGGFQMIHYYIFFVLLVLLLRTQKEWENIFKFSLVAAGGMILYGIMANLGTQGFIGPYTGSAAPIPTSWWHKVIDWRFQGSLGNPAYVAPYLMFSMFYGAYLWIKRKTKTNGNAAAHVGYGIMIATLLFFFILSQTRGAFIGLVAAAAALLFYFISFGRGALRKWSLGALMLFVILGATGYAARNSPAVLDSPVGRLLHISASDATAQSRFWVWGGAWKGFLERPILGWGPENFTAVYDKYFDPRFFVPGVQSETWFDRAHGVYFDYLAETGVLGFLSYLGIFFVFGWEFFKKKNVTAERQSSVAIIERGIILALPVAYLVQGVAIFDVLPMYINLFFFAAFMNYYFYKTNEHNA